MRRRVLSGIQIFSIFFLCIHLPSQAQQVTIKGRVTDAETGDPLPFVSIGIAKTTFGSYTDFDGYYIIKAPVKQGDTLVASYMGYIRRKKPIPIGVNPVHIDFQLVPDVTTLEEVIIKPKIDPAIAVMREVMKNKKRNDKRNLSSYQYESYSKVEISIDNINSKLERSKLIRDIREMLDTAILAAGEDGKPIIPVFISETISDYYVNNRPYKTKEIVKAVKVSGIGIEDGKLVSQIIGSSFQEYNFYKNYLNIMGKDFLSPLADSWEIFYEYKMLDTLYVGDKWCYKLEVKPKQDKDLAFTGTIWITDTTYALRQIDVRIGKSANINFVEKMIVQQELSMHGDSAWIPDKTRVLVDLSDISHYRAGALVKFYLSTKNVKINQELPDNFFDVMVEVREDADRLGKNMIQLRHDSLSKEEASTYNMINTIRQVPIVRFYTELSKTAVLGYKRAGYIDFGPYANVFNYNNIEGVRLGLGFRTNIRFSKKIIFRPFVSYGFKDQRWKYSFNAEYIFDKKRWTTLSLERRVDLDQVGINPDNFTSTSVFFAFSRNGTLIGPYFGHINTVRFQTDISRYLIQKISFRTRSFNAEYPFAYYTSAISGDTSKSDAFDVSEIITETTIGRQMHFLINDNERLFMGSGKWPVFTFKNTFGLKNILGSDFHYYKISLRVSQNFRVGVLGRSYYDFNIGKIFAKLPYPLLEIHQGNQFIFYSTATFNLMNYFEFISDTYASLNYRHYFEGLLFNRVPLLRRLKWREVVGTNLVYGSVGKGNQNFLPSTDLEGNLLRPYYTLVNKPYVEITYGVENIFKLLRIDFIHRLSYLSNPDANKFAVKFSVQFSL
ncbi:MAG: DUF5686 and carboxypeptidase regulatory-like domain-containing protein [Cytophagaceae bacterium]|nr:DUF5686 and carboxypeptidase regulatory-like domain-containing protein [Cytophagaceae bacterium]MDW8456766.1 DUF5686 family protein [Cytophagaceae bacterium]